MLQRDVHLDSRDNAPCKCKEKLRCTEKMLPSEKGNTKQPQVSAVTEP